jgi:type VI secretion system protein ImpG
VHTVQRVVQLAASGGIERDLLPLHATDTRSDASVERPRYVIERAARRLSPGELQGASAYAGYLGDDVFLRLVSANAGNATATRLQIHALCTHRDLAMQLALGRGSTDFTLATGAPLRSVRCVTGPTAPRSSQLQGAAGWDMLSHWSQTSIALHDPQTGGEALRELLRLFAQRGDLQLSREIDSVASVSSASVIRPRPAPGPWQFVRGLEIKLTCDEQGFGAHRAFTLAAVLSHFFARHAPEHSFAETVLQTPLRGEVHRWPPVAGLRPVL